MSEVSRTPKRWRSVMLAGTVAVVAALAVAVLTGLVAWPWSTSADPLARAWERAADAGSYRFRGDVEQVRQPVGSVLNAGKAPKTDRIHLEGDTDLEASSAQFDVWTGAGSLATDDAALAVRVADGVTSQRVRGGEWTPADESASLLAPNGNYLSYLLAARDVAPIGTEVRGGRTITRYRFGIDGPRFATMVAEQAADALRARGGLAPGSQVLPAVQFRDMAGSGELWVDAGGLPVRQVLQLRFPEQAGERISADITLDFHDYGFAPHGGWMSNTAWPVARTVLLAALVGLVCTLVIVGFRRCGRVTRRLTVVVVSTSLVASAMVATAGAATPAGGLHLTSRDGVRVLSDHR